MGCLIRAHEPFANFILLLATMHKASLYLSALIVHYGIPHLPPDSFREQETAGATEPDELDHYPVPTSPQPRREQCVDEQEYDYIEQPVMTVNMHKLLSMNQTCLN